MRSLAPTPDPITLLPSYEFHHAPTNETISVYVGLDEPASARAQQVQGGKLYKRVYAAPLAARDTKLHDGTQTDFTRAVQDKQMTVGEAWEVSKEMSEKRAKLNGGVDPQKEQFYRDYQTKTGGRHADVIKREAKAANEKRMKEFGIRVE